MSYVTTNAPDMGSGLFDVIDGEVKFVDGVKRVAAFPAFLLNRLKQEIKIARQISPSSGVPVLNRLSLP